MRDQGLSAGVRSFHLVECTGKWLFPGYFACGTDTRQQALIASSYWRAPMQVDLFDRLVRAECVRMVAVLDLVGPVAVRSCAASMLSASVFTSRLRRRVSDVLNHPAD